MLYVALEVFLPAGDVRFGVFDREDVLKMYRLCCSDEGEYHIALSLPALGVPVLNQSTGWFRDQIKHLNEIFILIKQSVAH